MVKPYRKEGAALTVRLTWFFKSGTSCARCGDIRGHCCIYSADPSRSPGTICFINMESGDRIILSSLGNVRVDRTQRELRCHTGPLVYAAKNFISKAK